MRHPAARRLLPSIAGLVLLACAVTAQAAAGAKVVLRWDPTQFAPRGTGSSLYGVSYGLSGDGWDGRNVAPNPVASPRNYIVSRSIDATAIASPTESAAQKKASQAGIIIVSGKNDGPYAHKAPGVGPLVGKRVDPAVIAQAQIRSGEAVDFDALAARGSAIAAADPLAMELRSQQANAAAQRGFDIGMAAAEAQTSARPEQTFEYYIAQSSKLSQGDNRKNIEVMQEQLKSLKAGKSHLIGKILDDMDRAEQAGFASAVSFSMARNRMKITDLAPRGAQIASEDPLAMELRNNHPEGAARLGFDIGMAVAEGQTAPGPGKDRIRDSLLDAEKGGFLFAVSYSLDRNRNAERAATGAAIAAADPAVAAARRAQPDVLNKLGFDIATGIFGDPALGAQGNTALGPGSMGIRNALSPSALQGFDDAVAFHLRRTYSR